MAEEIRKVIHIDTSRSATSVKDLRDEIKSLRDALVQLDSTSEQYVQIAQQVAQREQKLAQVMSASKNVLTPYQRSLNALTATYSNQRQELRALRTALENLDPATAEYRAAFERAAELTHELQERQELLRRSSSDLGVQLSNMRDIATGFAAGWNSVNALMTLTGNNSEEVQEAMKKLQAGIALVQGLQGLEGLGKAIKGYITGSAKWYDKIMSNIKGEKDLTKQINTNTTATEVNTTVGQANTTALQSQGVAGQKAATGFKAATVAGVQLSAVLKSLAITSVIGVVIAGITAAINALVKASNKLKDTEKRNAENSIALWEKRIELSDDYYQRDIELAKARGATEKEVYDKTFRYYKKRAEIYDKEEKQIEKISDAFKNWSEGGLKTKIQPSIADAYIPDVTFRGEEATKGYGVVAKLEARLKLITKDIPYFAGTLSKEYQEAFEKISKNGIRTYQDLINAQKIYSEAVVQFKWATQDTFDGVNQEMKVSAEEAVKEARDGLKSGTQLLEEQRQARLELVKQGNALERAQAIKDAKKNGEDVGKVKEYYETKTNEDLATINKYYDKKVKEERNKNNKSYINERESDMKKALERLKTFGLSELEILTQEYEKEQDLLKGNHDALLKLQKEYEKKRSEIIGKNAKKTINDTMASWGLQVSGLTQGAGQEKELLAIQGKPTAEAVQKYNDLIYSYDVQLAEDEKALWESVAKSAEVDAETRAEAERKVQELTIKLSDLATEKIINDAKTRKDKVQEEIDELNRELDKMEAKASKDLFESQTGYTMSHTNNASGAGFGILEAVWGGKNASYKQMQEQMDTENAIITAGLEARIAALKKFKAENELTKDQMLAYDQQIASLETELNKQVADNQIQTAELTQEKWQTFLDAGLSVMNSFADILGSVADTMEAEVQHQLELGQITEEQAEEQRKKIKAIQIAQTIVSTISGAIGAFTQASATIPPPAGQIVGGAAAAAVIAAGVAAIAQMRATNKNTNSISNSLPIASPSMAGFEKDYEANMTGNSEVSALRNAIEGADIRAYVVESDITSAQNRSRRRSSESTF